VLPMMVHTVRTATARSHSSPNHAGSTGGGRQLEGVRKKASQHRLDKAVGGRTSGGRQTYWRLPRGPHTTARPLPPPIVPRWRSARWPLRRAAVPAAAPRGASPLHSGSDTMIAPVCMHPIGREEPYLRDREFLATMGETCLVFTSPGRRGAAHLGHEEMADDVSADLTASYPQLASLIRYLCVYLVSAEPNTGQFFACRSSLHCRPIRVVQYCSCQRLTRQAPAAEPPRDSGASADRGPTHPQLRAVFWNEIFHGFLENIYSEPPPHAQPGGASLFQSTVVQAYR